MTHDQLMVEQEDDLTREIAQAALQALRDQAEAWPLEEAEAWLRELDPTLWGPKRWSRGFSKPWQPAIDDSVTREQWEIFKTLATRFPCIPHNAAFHFGFGLTLLTFPATPGASLERLCTVNTDHLGDKLLDKLAAEAGYEPNNRCGQAFEKGWYIMSPLSHTDKNREWHELYGIGGLDKKERYEY